MVKKDNKMTIFIVIGLILMAFFFFKGGVDYGIQDEGVNFKVYAYDSNKELIGEIAKGGSGLQATVTFGGGDPNYGVQYIKIQSTISHTTGVDVTVTDLTASPTEYSTAISAYTKAFVLSAGQSNVQTSDFIDIAAMGVGTHTFTLNVAAFYRDAQGNQIALNPFGSVIVSVIADVCSDNTPEGTCSSTLPLFCDGGNLVDQATTCGCVAGWEIIGESCSHLQCGTTFADNCIPETLGTFNPQYCTIDGNTIDGCGSSLCGVATTACADDYYNNPPLGCTVSDTCEYDVYSGDIIVDLGDDGAGGSTYVMFRSNGIYDDDPGAVAYSNSCDGSTLTRYGYTGTVLFNDCSDYNILIDGAVGSRICNNIFIPHTLYVEYYEENRLGRFEFNTGNYDQVSASATSVDPANEITC